MDEMELEAPLKQELCDAYISCAAPQSLKDALHAYAQTYGVTDSHAARHILSRFLQPSLQKKQDNLQKTKGRKSQIKELA